MENDLNKIQRRIRNCEAAASAATDPDMKLLWAWNVGMLKLEEARELEE